MRLELYLSLAASTAMIIQDYGCMAVKLAETASLPAIEASDLEQPMMHAQTELIPDGIVQMYHKAMEHIFPSSRQTETKNHGCKVNMVDANRNASTAGRKVGGNSSSNMGDGDSTFSGQQNKVFAGSWFPQTENQIEEITERFE